MRKQIFFIAFILTLVCAPIFVHAQDYTNNLGVVISETDYNNLRKIYSENKLAVLSQEKYDQILSMDLDYNNIHAQTKYIKTEINNVTGEVIETEVTKEEYDNANANIQTRATLVETGYKKLTMDLIISNAEAMTAFMSVNLQWKASPKIRSFDVIGVRLSNMTVINGTQQGQQIYMIDGVIDYVQYNFNGTNIRNLDNGFGISMNLLNADVEALECTIDSSLSIKGFPAGLFGSYQHAVENVTLATSQNYTIGAGGLGSVFIYPDNIRAKYDSMNGVYDYFSSATD